MKRKLLILSLICSMGMFTSCADKTNDDWKDIPTTEIAADNAILTVNGMQQKGSIKLQVSNATAGVLTLNNLLLGYQNMDVDVALTAKGDGSFDFSGEKTFNFAEVKSASDYATMMTIKLNGNITLDGKATVTVTTSANGGLVGTWSFSDTVGYATEPAISVNVAPVLIYWPAKNYDEENEIKNGYQLGNIGSTIISHLIGEVLNKVTFNEDGSITAKYYSEIVLGESPDLQEWIMSKMFSEGPITPLERTWMDAPKGFASWYAKGDKIYIMPNIESIIKSVAGEEVDVKTLMSMIEGMKVAKDEELQAIISALGNEIGMDLDKIPVALVKEVLNWTTTGIPFKYKTKENYLYIHVDKKMVESYMPLALSLLPMLQAELDKLAESNEMIAMLPLLLGVEKLTDFSTIWETNTTDVFEIGLMLKK